MTTANFIDHLKTFEGNYPYFYLDSERNVTIGVGIMFRNSADAISSGIRFTKKNDNKPATAAEIISDFNAVKRSGVHSLSRYAEIAKLRADTSDLDRIFSDRLQEATQRAKRFYDLGQVVENSTYPTFDKLPDNIRFAVIDLSFNLGNKINKYQKLRQHLKKGEWSEASNESRRFNVQGSRNSKIAQWIAWNIEVKY